MEYDRVILGVCDVVISQSKYNISSKDSGRECDFLTWPREVHLGYSPILNFRTIAALLWLAKISESVDIKRIFGHRVEWG